MWRHNTIYISDRKLNQWQIFNTILRSDLDLPQFGALMLKKESVDLLDAVIQPLVV